MKNTHLVLAWAVSSALGFEIIAHRGFSGVHPESTVSAFEAAVAAGADWLECDVVPSKDGVIYCSHEPHIGEINSNVMEIHSDANSPFKVPANGLPSHTVENSPDGPYVHNVTGWFFCETDSQDIDTLKVAQRYHERDQGASHKDSFLKLKDFIKIARRHGKGLYIEPKHSDWHYTVKGIELNMLIVETLVKEFGGELVDVEDDEMPKLDVSSFGGTPAETNRWMYTVESARTKVNNKQVRFPNGAFDIPVIIESFLVEDLAFYKFIGWSDIQPSCALTWKTADYPDALWGSYYLQNGVDANGPVLKGYPADSPGLEALGVKYLGPDKSLILEDPSLVTSAHDAGIKVHAWTFRNENSNVVVHSYDEQTGQKYDGYQIVKSTDRNINARFQGCAQSELEWFIRSGLDGVFTDHVLTAAKFREGLATSGSQASMALGVSAIIALVSAVKM